MTTKVIKSFTPTEAVLANAARGNALKTAFKRGNVEKSVKSEMTLNDVKSLYNALVKSADTFKPLDREEDGGPTEESIDFLSNGGSSGLAWCRHILRNEGILKSYTKEITEKDLSKEDSIKGFDWKIEKSTDEALKQVTYVAMVPEETDLQGDVTSVEEVRKAMESFNKSSMRANLFHRVMTDTFYVVESYVAPTDFVLNEIPVKKGTWLMTLQITNDDVWDLIKSGQINGISIGAVAHVHTLESETDD